MAISPEYSAPNVVNRIGWMLLVLGAVFLSGKTVASPISEHQLDLIRQTVSDENTYVSRTWEHVLAASKTMLNDPPLERRQEGRRMLGTSREAFKRIVYLGHSAQVLGSPAGDIFARRAIEEMLSVSRFSDWNPSHFLDTAEMTAALGLGLGLLAGWASPEEYAAISEAIVTKGLIPGLAEPDPWWTRALNNWNQVCNAGLAIGALAVAEYEPELAERLIHRALENMPLALGAYGPDGVYPEGPMYWAYGTTYTILFIDAMRSSGLLPDSWLSDHQPFMRSSWFMLHATGPTGQLFNFGDSSSTARLLPALFWFAREMQTPELLFNQHARLKALSENTEEISVAGASRFLPFLLHWAIGVDGNATPQQKSWFGHGKKSLALLRNSWAQNASYLAIVGGIADVSHGQLDAGSFIYETQGHRWIIDLGAPAYEPLERQGLDIWDRAESSDRWQILHFSNQGHNTLTIDGEIQSPQETAVMRDRGHFSPNEGAFSVIDLTPVYRTKLTSATRLASLLPNGDALIQDTLVALPGKQASVSWRVFVDADVEISEDGKSALLSYDHRHLVLSIKKPDGAYIETASPIVNAQLAVPEPIRQLQIDLDLQPGETQTIEVEFRSSFNIQVPRTN